MTVDHGQHGFAHTVEEARPRTWQLGRGQSKLVTDQFDSESFRLVVDDRGDVHIASTDGHLYVGWFPHGRLGAHTEGWVLTHSGTRAAMGYRITFDVETPAVIVAAAVRAVLETSRRTGI
jgi:hypothetical protein